ncbi:hypothetical protein BASA81_012507 [Batrachochytrium salamandrivorans]|nr:hypothetical protein BASA81_012507 [Batrachochytrium salamandrivorans]
MSLVFRFWVGGGEEVRATGLRFGSLFVVSSPHHYLPQSRQISISSSQLQSRQSLTSRGNFFFPLLEEEDCALFGLVHDEEGENGDFFNFPSPSRLVQEEELVFVDLGSRKLESRVVHVGGPGGKVWISVGSDRRAGGVEGYPVFTSRGELVGIVASTDALLGLSAVVDLHALGRRNKGRHEARLALNAFRQLQDHALPPPVNRHTRMRQELDLALAEALGDLSKV